MRTSGNTVLITGGATGIGFALAKRLNDTGSKVIICGRRESRLAEAKAKIPSLDTIRCDISLESERKMLFDRIASDFPETNMLVNNAGIQRRIDLTKGLPNLSQNDDEIEINFRAQVYLSMAFVPFLSKQKEPAIVNVSSGLGFVPLAMFPVYCATKAAIHSFTLSLRHQLQPVGVRVFEVIPPTVYDTELKGKPIEKADWTVSAAEVAEAAVKGIEADNYEIGIGAAEAWTKASREELDKTFSNINH